MHDEHGGVLAVDQGPARIEYDGCLARSVSQGAQRRNGTGVGEMHVVGNGGHDTALGWTIGCDVDLAFCRWIVADRI